MALLTPFQWLDYHRVQCDIEDSFKCGLLIWFMAILFCDLETPNKPSHELSGVLVLISLHVVLLLVIVCNLMVLYRSQ